MAEMWLRFSATLIVTVWGPKLIKIAKVRVRGVRVLGLGIRSRVLFGVHIEQLGVRKRSSLDATLVLHRC